MPFKRILTVLAALLLLAVGVFVQPAPAAADTDTVRVRLSVDGDSTLSMKLDGEYFVDGADAPIDSGTLKFKRSGSKITVTHSRLGELTTARKIHVTRTNPAVDGGTAIFKVSGYTRNYLGDFTVYADNGTLRVVNTVPLSHYLYGVVGYEMSNAWPLEALKAQAVAAKNYAISKIGAHADYDVVDTASDQVYKGYVSTLKNVIAAVDATMHMALYLNDSIMPCWYSASNGGYSILPSDNWSSTAYDAGYAAGTDPFDIRNTACRSESLYIPRDLARRSFSSAALYNYIMEKLSAAAAEKGAISDGFVFDAWQGVTSIVSTDENGVATADGDHDQIILTASMKTVPDPRFATPAPTPSPTPNLTPTPTPTATPTPTPTAEPTATPTAEPTAAPESTPEAGTDTDTEDTEETDAEATATPTEEPSPTAEPTATPKPTETPKPTKTPVPTPTPAPFVPETEREEQVVVTITFQELFDAGLFTDDVLRIYHAMPAEGGWTLYHGRFGHGVGMSQRGAQQMANEGWNYQQILGFYYPGAEVRSLDYRFPEEKAESAPLVTPAPTASPAPDATSAPEITPVPNVTPVPTSPTHTPVSDGATALVGSASPLFDRPDAAASALTQLSAGTRLKLVGLVGDWYAAELLDGSAAGYLHYRNVSVLQETPLCEAKVTGGGVNLRTGPGKEYDSLTKLSKGSTVTILFHAGSWMRVETEGGTTGYMSRDYLSWADESDAQKATPTPEPTPEVTLAPNETATPVPIVTAPPSPTPTPLPDKATDGRFTAMARINATNVNFRKGPSTSTASLGKYSRGTDFGIYGKTGSWYRVCLIETGQDGYVYAKYLSLLHSGTGDTVSIAKGKLTTGGVNIRTGASTRYKSLGKLSKNTAVTIQGSEGSWYRVRVDASGQEGYVFARYISMIETGSAQGTTASSGQATVRAGLLNLRDKPDENRGKVLCTMRRGYTVTVHSLADGWAEVTYNGKRGYCAAKYLTLQ